MRKVEKKEGRKQGRERGRKDNMQGSSISMDCLWMQKDVALLQGFFRALSGWAWVSSFLIEFYLFRREQEKYCLTGPAPPLCNPEEGERPGIASPRAFFQACVNKLR